MKIEQKPVLHTSTTIVSEILRQKFCYLASCIPLMQVLYTRKDGESGITVAVTQIWSFSNGLLAQCPGQNHNRELSKGGGRTVMSATAEMKTKDSKRKSESKRTGTSEKKAAANKRNSEKSTGPRTAEGKEKSKFNSTTHGLTARSALLPGEDPAGLNALRCELLEGLQPRNSLESTLIVRIAEDKWISDRAEQAASRRVAERLRHEPLEQAQKESDDALELGEHLLWNLARPLPFDASSQSVSLGEPPHAGEPVHPSHPTRVRLRLETTVAGCDWLLDRWGELDRRLRIENAWLPSDAFKMVRLLGMHAIDMDEDFKWPGY